MRGKIGLNGAFGWIQGWIDCCFRWVWCFLGEKGNSQIGTYPIYVLFMITTKLAVTCKFYSFSNMVFLINISIYFSDIVSKSLLSYIYIRYKVLLISFRQDISLQPELLPLFLSLLEFLLYRCHYLNRHLSHLQYLQFP